MQALLVVDIDHGDFWRPDDVQNNPQQKQVAEEIKRVLKEKRAKNEIIVFIVLARGEKIAGEKITGQEAQLECSQPQDTAGGNKPLIERVLNKFGISSDPIATESQSGKCIVCDELPERYRLALFLEHRHEPQFETIFIKSRGDAFSNLKLAPYLRSRGVDEVVLAGCNTFLCVLDTAIGALIAGFNATLLSKCAYPPFTAEDHNGYNSPEQWIAEAIKKSEQSRFTAKII